MAIGDDFTIDYTDKTIRHTSGTTIYTVNELYSWLQDTFDELAQLDDTVPMSAQTPTEYTLTNGWFMDPESIKFLETGAIQTSGWTHPTSTTGIRLLTLSSSGYTNCVSGDIGKTVTGGTTGDTGVLLDYNNATYEWWVRCVAADDLFDDADEALTIASGTGAGSMSKVSETGENLWSCVYTLGSLMSGTYVYVVQNDERLTEWWASGHIDILILVKKAGTEIDDGGVTIFSRRFSDTYDHYYIDLSDGGRNAVPLATADDLNNETLEDYLLYDGETGGGFTVGDTITGATSGATAILSSLSDQGLYGILGLVEVSGTFVNDENLQVSATTRGVANGTIGGTYFAYDNEAGGSFTVGSTLTIGTLSYTGTLRGLQDDGTTGFMVVQNLDGQIADNDTITQGAVTALINGTVYEAVGGYTDIIVGQVSGTLAYTGTGGFAKWDKITGGTSANTAYVLYDDTAGDTLTIIGATGQFTPTETITGGGCSATVSSSVNEATTTFNENLDNGSGAQPYDVHCNLKSRTVLQFYEFCKYLTRRGSTIAIIQNDGSALTSVEGQQYKAAQSTYTEVKPSPLGTFAGGIFFGARGVWIEDMHGDDVQAFQLIDSDGDTQIPPNTVSAIVTSVVAGDRVAVFRLTGVGGSINKSMYTLAAGNDIGEGTIVLSSSLSSDTPQAGYVRIVLATGAEHLYEYTSWATDTLTIVGTLTQSYDAGLAVYIPIIDDQATGSTISNSLIYSSSVPVIVRVRLKGILPFEVESAIGATGMSVAAIRTVDNIVT